MLLVLQRAACARVDISRTPKSFIMALHSRRPDELGTGLVDLLLTDCIDQAASFPPPQHLYSHREGTFLDLVLDDVDNAAKA